MAEILSPREIEKRSFEIIADMLKDKDIDPETKDIVFRAVHTTADPDYADNLWFSPGAVEKGLEALREGCDIVTDTRMAEAGINKKALSALGGTARCFMADEDVAKEAASRGVTRAIVSMERAASLERPFILACGNAPTALMKITELHEKGMIAPRLVIGVPVGFVNVVESKEMLMESGIPCIVARGRKGGSNVAAAIVNALMYRLVRR